MKKTFTAPWANAINGIRLIVFLLVSFSTHNIFAKEPPCPAVRKAVMFRPCNRQFIQPVFGNENGKYVEEKLELAGYVVNDLVDGQATIESFIDNVLKSDAAMIYIHTHGVNQGFVAQTFYYSDYQDKTYSLAAPCAPGDTTIILESIEGLAETGELWIFNSDCVEYRIINDVVFVVGVDEKAINFHYGAGTPVNWRKDNQAWAAAIQQQYVLESKGVAEPGDIEVVDIAGQFLVSITGNDAAGLMITPSFIRRHGRLTNAVVYVDACESAGYPTGLDTELDEAFIVAGAHNYVGYDVSVGAGLTPVDYIRGSSPAMVQNFFHRITDGNDRLNIRDAVSAANDDIFPIFGRHLQNVSVLAHGYDAGKTVLFYTGQLADQSIPPEGTVTFGQTYPFTVSVTNSGQYAETYQVNLAIHNSQYQEIISIIENPVTVDPHSSRQVVLQWPVDTAHGVSSLGTYQIGIGLWPEDPSYQTEPILDVLGYYAYTINSFPPQSIAGRVTADANGSGIDGVAVAFSAGAGTATTANGGYFSQPVQYGWSGTVTPSMNGWQFAPSTYSFSTPVTETPAPLNFTASLLPAKRIVLDRTSIQVPEGRRGWFNVCLSEAPAQNVTVSVVRISGDSDLSVTNDTRRIFTTTNWKTNQTVPVDAGEDSDESAGVAIFQCSASGWQSAEVTAVEADNDGGSVQVIILPAEASPAGGQWRVEGGAWHNSGEVDSDVPWAQDFRIEFKDIPEWYTPAPVSVLLNAYHPSEIATGVYTKAVSGSGSVRIDIMPPQAVASGAMWRLDGGAWNQSGVTIRGVAAGAHTVEFSAVNGFVTAGRQQINLVPDCDFVNSGIYSSEDTCVVLSPGDNIQSAITAATNGMHIILNDGSYNLGNNGTLTIEQGIVLRSRNGYSACTLIADTDERCVNINNADAIVDGLSLSSLLDRAVTGNGGAVTLAGGTLANSRVYDSMSEYNGGGIAGNGTIRNCLIEGCWAEIDHGGGVYGSGSLQYSTIRNCYADETGGAIAGTWDVVGCELTGNRAAGSRGGAVVSYGTSAYRNCLIVNNNAYGDGGGIYIEQGVIEGCRITDNFSDGDGGGVYTPGGAGLVISNCVFVRNRSDLSGGGICNESISSEGIVHIVGCVLSNNISENAEGGGIYSENNLVVTGCRVTSNVADDPADVDGQGGGIYVAENATIENCIVSFNRADEEGGGIYAHGQNVRVVGCLLFKNSAAYGGGYYNNYYGNTISDCTVVYNTATTQGGGLFRDSGSPVYRNCIVYFNTAPSDANFNDRSVSAYNCCITPLPGTGSGNTIASPSFVSAGQDNYRLRSDSPCVDTGDISDHNKDLDGVPVPLDGNNSGTSENDIGAYEYVPPSGSIIVRIDPVYAADAGGLWSIGGTNWYASDQRVDYVPAGNRTLSFTNIQGWAAPTSCSLSISAGTLVATNGVYLPLSADTDGDELPDDWEIEHYGRLTNVNFSSDSDGDLLTEYYEHLAGTDPRDPTSCLVFTEGSISTVPGPGVSLRWYSGTGLSYRVCRTTNLVNGFQVIAPVVSGTAPMTFYTDPSQSGRANFYRIEKNP